MPNSAVAKTPCTTEDPPLLTLQDVLQTSPSESQVESLLFRNIMDEATNQTSEGENNTWNGLLDSIPDESLHLFTSTPRLDMGLLDKPLDVHSSCTASPCSPHTAIARPSRVLRFASQSPTPRRRIPKQFSMRSAKQQRPSQLATMAQRWDAFQHVPSVPRCNEHPSNAEVQQSVPSAAEIMVLQSRLAGDERSNGSNALLHRHSPPVASLSVSPPNGASPPVAPSVKKSPTLLDGITSPEALKVYKKTDTLLDDELGSHDVESGTKASLNGTLLSEEMKDRRWRCCGWLAWFESQWRKPPSHRTLIQRLLPPKQHTIWTDLEIFLEQRRDAFFQYARFFLWIVLPALAIACILYYFAGNPPTGKVDLERSGNGIFLHSDGTLLKMNRASISWWLLFICVRQALTFSLAQILQVIIVDFFCLNTRFFVHVLGQLLSLFLTVWKGWPFIAFLWGILDFIFLFGESKFAAHWLYWQKVLTILTDSNPSGSVTHSLWYTRVLSIAVCVGLVVGIKRLWLGLYLGRKTYVNHYEDLFRVYKKILTLCAVGELSRHSVTISKKSLLSSPYSPFGIHREDLDEMLQLESSEDEEKSIIIPSQKSSSSRSQGGFILDPNYSDSGREIVSPSEKAKIDELLGAWEEPDSEAGIVESASISNVLEFRNALAKLDKPYMLGIAWGDVSTREKMICTSQIVYRKLRRLSSNPEESLQFDVLAALTEQLDGTLHPNELKHLIRLLRPDRHGHLSLAEFVKSVDAVYKEAKLVQASVKNSEKIDREFEKALNIPFYTVVTCIILSQIGLNPLTLFISLSPLILGFSWMIGSASSKMFEGWLFILIRRPYNIGDHIHIGSVESECSWDGSTSWIVQDVTLFHTIAIFSPTGERASMSNGSLASSRVLNMSRSPNACVYVNLHFPTSVPYERIQQFESLLRDFIQARPREWAHFAAFRATSVIANLGLIGYEVMLIHRESWHSIQSIYESKAQVASFAMELSKKLDMRYESPSLPVDLRFSSSQQSVHRLPNCDDNKEDEGRVSTNRDGQTHHFDVSHVYKEWMAMGRGKMSG